jgi:hypothetical protein
MQGCFFSFFRIKLVKQGVVVTDINHSKALEKGFSF